MRQYREELDEEMIGRARRDRTKKLSKGKRSKTKGHQINRGWIPFITKAHLKAASHARLETPIHAQTT